MKQRFRLVQLGNRGGAFCCKDILTGARTSLHAKDRGEAERLIQYKNEALQARGRSFKAASVRE